MRYNDVSMISLTDRIRTRAYFGWLNRRADESDELGDWVAAERVETSATLYFDECRTPATTEDFIVAGYGIYGDHERVKLAWEALLKERGLHKRKGRKFTDDDMDAVAAFVVNQDLLPIASHSRLNAEDLSAAAAKIRDLTLLANEAGAENDLVRRPGSYVWLTQVVLTVGPSMVSFLLRMGGVTRRTIT